MEVGTLVLAVIAIIIGLVNKSDSKTNSEELRKQIEDNAIKSENHIENVNAKLSEQLRNVTTELKEVLDENKELKKKLEFFTEINEDSANLNVKEDEEAREELIQQVIKSLKTVPDDNNKYKKSEIKKTWEPDKLVEKQDKDKEIKKQETIKKTAIKKVDKTVVPKKNENIEEGIQQAKSTVIPLDLEQLKAYRKMNDSNGNLFITGKAGTGKSFLLEVFERITEKKIIKLAPTGIAALNIGGATLHSAFGYQNLESLQADEISKATLRLKSEKQMILRVVDAIVIDEISMVRADVFDKIDKILQVVNGTSEPFGGKQMIVFGDLFQLPPIAERELQKYLIDRYGGIYFFQSDGYKKGKFEFIELSTNHRQKDDATFFEILNRMREGRIDKNDINTLNNRCISNPNELRRVITLFPTKAQAESLNKRELAAIEAKEYSFRARIVFNAKNNQTPKLESSFPITENLKLKLGALVMLTANDSDKRWVNGTLGVVSFISDSAIKVDIDKRTYEVKPVKFTEQEITYANGKIQYEKVLEVEQYPIMLAYAITIHKSQGMTYQKVACNINNCFASGQAYVALSRCVSLSGLYLLDQITERNIDVDEVVKQFYITQSKNKGSIS